MWESRALWLSSPLSNTTRKWKAAATGKLQMWTVTALACESVYQPHYLYWPSLKSCTKASELITATSFATQKRFFAFLPSLPEGTGMEQCCHIPSHSCLKAGHLLYLQHIYYMLYYAGVIWIQKGRAALSIRWKSKAVQRIHHTDGGLLEYKPQHRYLRRAQTLTHRARINSASLQFLPTLTALKVE